MNMKQEQDLVYVVTIMVRQGMEFPEQLYYGVFSDKSKALKYHYAECRDWRDKLCDRYCNDGETVTTLVDSENRTIIYADYDYKDAVIIELKTKIIQ